MIRHDLGEAMNLYLQGKITFDEHEKIIEETKIKSFDEMMDIMVNEGYGHMWISWTFHCCILNGAPEDFININNDRMWVPQTASSQAMREKYVEPIEVKGWSNMYRLTQKAIDEFKKCPPEKNDA